MPQFFKTIFEFVLGIVTQFQDLGRDGSFIINLIAKFLGSDKVF